MGYRLGQLDHWGALVLRIGDVQNGGTSLPDRSVGDAPPSGPPKRALGLRRGLRGLRLVRSFAEAAVLVSDPAVSQAQLYSLEGLVEVEGFTEGEFWYWTDDAENKSKPALRVRVIRVAAQKRKNDVWLVTNVLDPKTAGGIGGSILPDEVGK